MKLTLWCGAFAAVLTFIASFSMPGRVSPSPAVMAASGFAGGLLFGLLGSWAVRLAGRRHS